MDETHLTEVRLGRVAALAGDVLHGRTEVRVTLDAEASDQGDGVAYP